jgi:invasion protein IalB
MTPDNVPAKKKRCTKYKVNATAPFASELLSTYKEETSANEDSCAIRGNSLLP